MAAVLDPGDPPAFEWTGQVEPCTDQVLAAHPPESLILGHSVRPIGVLRLIDDGERDDKIVCVARQGPLSNVTDLESLESRYAGVLTIIETWFTSYKGRGRLRSNGFDDEAAAIEIILKASRSFEQGGGREE